MKLPLRFTPVLVLLVLLAPFGAWAQPYLAADAVDPARLLPPPPEATSREQTVDLATVVSVHASRTPEEEAAGKFESDISFYTFAPQIGSWFQPGHFPKTDALLREAQKEIKHATDEGKNTWKRPRPYALDPTIVPFKKEKSYSYPSGHSTLGTAAAFILAELFPDKRDALIAEGKSIGWDRIVLGVHYPSDVYAGRVLGRALAQALLANPDFQRDLAAARAELAAAGH